MWAVGLVLVSAPIVLHIQRADGLPPGSSSAVLSEMSRGLETATGREARIDEVAACADEQACAKEIGARFGTDDVVLIQLFGAVRSARARVVVVARDGKPKRRADIEYPIEALDEWPPIFEGLGAVLFPRDALRLDVRAAPAVTAPAIVAPPLADPSLAPVIAWSSVGVGAVLGGVAAVLRISANGTRDDVEALPVDDPSRAELISKSNSSGLVSNFLLGTGAVCIASGLTYLLTR